MEHLKVKECADRDMNKGRKTGGSNINRWKGMCCGSACGKRNDEDKGGVEGRTSAGGGMYSKLGQGRRRRSRRQKYL